MRSRSSKESHWGSRGSGGVAMVPRMWPSPEQGKLREGLEQSGPPFSRVL